MIDAKFTFNFKFMDHFNDQRIKRYCKAATSTNVKFGQKSSTQLIKKDERITSSESCITSSLLRLQKEAVLYLYMHAGWYMYNKAVPTRAVILARTYPTPCISEFLAKSPAMTFRHFQSH